ncbi:MAG: hypothetical protein SFW67_10240 [Myxococcaceae bacterium]|nr:hypothetical protein [Myxococcaceae bacterium]
MRRLLLVTLVSSAALADVPPSNASQCQGAQAGAACTTDDGKAGTCLTQKVGRLDYSEGVPPKSIEVDMLICVASASARVAVAPPYLAAGAVLAVMALLLGLKLAGRGRRLSPSS